MTRSHRSALVTVHVAVLLFGLAGVLGKLTDLPATVIVLGRVSLAGSSLAILLAVRRSPLLPRHLRDIPALAMTGCILALHWTAFFQAIRVSSVAVALLAFSTFPLFTTALEPVLLRTRPRLIDAVAALLIVPGIYLIVPTLDLRNSTTAGVAWGVLAGFSFAVLSIWNRHLTRTHPSVVISLYQDGVAALVLLPTLWLLPPAHGISLADLGILIILGVVCTALAHTLYIEAMRTVSAQTASVIASLEPVWGILVALILLGEVPAWRTLVGGAIVLGATALPRLRLHLPRGSALNLGGARPRGWRGSGPGQE